MAALFANAILTIIAAQGKDAGHGLRGVTDITKPMQRRQTVSPIHGGRKIIVNSPEQREIKTSVWEHRAWTFQEALFSRRTLRFKDNEVRWDCDSTSYTEDQITDLEGCRVRDIQIESVVEPWYSALDPKWIFTRPYPNFYDYIDLEWRYRMRDLTYASDALAAFAGIESLLQFSFPRGFLCGLPELFLDMSLLWDFREVSPEAEIGRRRPKRILDSPAAPMSMPLPSWSWAEWNNPIEWFVEYCGDVYCRNPAGASSLIRYHRRTHPIQWYSLEGHNLRKRQIGSHWQTYIEYAFNDSIEKELPVVGQDI
jgi:hypothetical protein